jgi:hypothetical protein
MTALLTLHCPSLKAGAWYELTDYIGQHTRSFFRREWEILPSGDTTIKFDEAIELPSLFTNCLDACFAEEMSEDEYDDQTEAETSGDESED